MAVQVPQQQRPHWTDNLRSIVRPVVTILVIIVLLSLFGYAIVHLLEIKDDVKSALGLLSGLAALASGIIGFWFGTRGQGGVALPNDAFPAEAAAGSGEGIVLITPLSGAQVVQLRTGALIPVIAQFPGPSARKLHGKVSAAADGTLLFHFMDEYVDGRVIQLKEAILASLPADTQSVETGTTLIS